MAGGLPQALFFCVQNNPNFLDPFFSCFCRKNTCFLLKIMQNKFGVVFWSKTRYDRKNKFFSHLSTKRRNFSNLFTLMLYLYNFWSVLLMAISIPILRIGALNFVQGHLRTYYWLSLGLTIAKQLLGLYYYRSPLRFWNSAKFHEMFHWNNILP